MAVPVSEASVPEGAAEPGRTSAELGGTQRCLPFQMARLLENKTKVRGMSVSLTETFHLLCTFMDWGSFPSILLGLVKRTWTPRIIFEN